MGVKGYLVFVPFEKTTQSISEIFSSRFSAGLTSGNVERESYAAMSLWVSWSLKLTPCSANACRSDLRVTSEKSS